MKKETFQFGMIGLGVMGRNFALNIADNGYSVAGLVHSKEKIPALQKEIGDRTVSLTASLQEFIAGLKKPRAIMMMVPAGKAVDSVIDELLPLLDKDDLIMDGGNSHFTDTDRRFKKLKEQGIHFMGVGISGGEEGARLGASIMPGGSKEAYSRVHPIFEAVAARVDNEPCVTWLGPGSAGHYVKMVHNGIEYALMQLIAECYDILKRGLGFTNDQLHQVFSEWNKGELSSYLIEITAQIFIQPDDKAAGRLIDAILDTAKQKGTGKWTSQSAMDLHVPTPVIDIAVTMRDLSDYKEERIHASQILDGVKTKFVGDAQQFVKQLENSLFFGMITAYAQGMNLLLAASAAYNYQLKLEDIAKIWRGGCIIRADMLETTRTAFKQNPHLDNLLVDPYFSKELLKRQSDLRAVVNQASFLGIPAPALMTSLAYFDAYRSQQLPANLTQAQRDFFGAHTYERIDAEGTFHTVWNNENKE